MDYKSTIQLPKTDFPMKGNLKQREPEQLKKWEETNIYDKLRQLRLGREKFILHDGPPYSNNNIHMGTAVNKIVKDFIVRAATMFGYDSPYVPGWDNHGMPIENQVLKELRAKKREVSKVEMRGECRKYAEKYINIQRDEFMRLGGWGSWRDPYLTMSPEFEAKIVEVFGELVEGGYIYRDFKPVHWCVTCATSLAQAEIEYEDKKSESIVIRFPLRQDPGGVFAGHDLSKCYVLIWTTTPWTIPANMAVVVHKDYEYSLIKTVAGDVYLLATKLIGPVMELIQAENVDEVKRLSGSELVGLVFKHPLFERDSPLFFADYVTLTDGTGIVHTAPGHGKEDFDTGKREGIPVLCPVDPKGYFTAEAHQYEGKRIWEGNSIVIGDLRANGTLLAHSTIEHAYPHCWRCHQPLIFRASLQWFLSVDHNDLRKRAMAEIDKVVWIPKNTINRIKDAVGDRPDWCLSRQRYWGVGIPGFFCEGCDEPLMTRETVDLVVKLVREKGSDAWYEVPAEQILPAGLKCAKCGGQKFRKEKDILDVWFDSGTTNRAVMEAHPELAWPCDVYFEGSDQHRGWFNSSLMVAMGTKNAAPFRQVITHGWILDEKGVAMSKSLGNVISPIDVVDRYGADLLRLWTASTDFRTDIKFSMKTMEQGITEAYRRIRNTFRFILGSLADFDPALHSIAYEKRPEIDRWFSGKVQGFIQRQTKCYRQYDYHEIFHEVNNFCVVDMSSLYMDIVKDRLYCDGVNSLSRRSAQTVLYEAGYALLTICAPILVFTTEEVWNYFPKRADAPESIHFLEFSAYDPKQTDSVLDAVWDKLLNVREEINKVVEAARAKKIVGRSLDAAIYIVVKDSGLKELLSQRADVLPAFFIASQVHLCQSIMDINTEFKVETDQLQIGVTAAPGQMCERCWQYLESVGTFADQPTLCHRCHHVITEVN